MKTTDSPPPNSGSNNATATANSVGGTSEGGTESSVADVESIQATTEQLAAKLGGVTTEGTEADSDGESSRVRKLLIRE